MGETTGISWTDHTWNPWHGCIKISPGCKLCYMYREKERYGQNPFIPVRSKTTFQAPLKWTSGRVFTCSWSDFFIEQADDWREDAWDIIRRTPHLSYQILTKRPERMTGHLPKDWGSGWSHVWLGVSVENQAYADERIPILCRTPAAIRFLSIEPQLEDVWIEPTLMGQDSCGRPDWVICGGESGHGARPFDIRWADSLRQQCKRADVAFFLKQFGSRPNSGGLPIRVTGAGADPAEWPEYLRVQQFPDERKRIA